MLKWCYVLLVSSIYTYQARFIFDDSCMTQSTAIIPDYCILKCVQILFDSKCCTNCEIGTEFWEKLKKNKQILFEKIRLELCFACKDGRCCQNTTNSHKFYGNIVHFFEAFNSSWCISAMNLNEIIKINPLSNCSKNDANKFHRKKRQLHRRLGGPDDPYSITYSDANLMLGSILFAIFLLFVLVCMCKVIAQFLDPPEDY